MIRPRRISGGEDPDTAIRNMDKALDSFGLDQPVTDFVGQYNKKTLAERMQTQEAKRGHVADLSKANQLINNQK